MSLSYKARRRWSVVILLVGLPLYIIAAAALISLAERQFGRLSLLPEAAVYLILGILWALPFRRVFRGIGQADPAPPPK